LVIFNLMNLNLYKVMNYDGQSAMPPQLNIYKFQHSWGMSNTNLPRKIGKQTNEVTPCNLQMCCA